MRHRSGTVGPKMTHFLATEDNPQGYRLEDVFELIRQDLIKRMGKIASDAKPEAHHVLKNDIRILALLTECIEVATDSTALLNRSFGPSKPSAPRIGVR